MSQSRTRRIQEPKVVLPEPSPAAQPPIEITWAEDPLKPNAVVQVTSGQNRGLLAIIGEINQHMAKLYYILPSGIGTADVDLSACSAIGMAKVAAKNPFGGQASPNVKEDPDSSFE